MEILEKTLKELPGLDCGSCGCPNCRSLAKDIVQGRAKETDCIFKLREKVRQLVEEVLDLMQKLPPTMEE
ncbi:(Fe-S)-binding protein [Thermosediminibacter oceani]|uniref:(Fe-S)-binding protein n=1 Tax=Thermosediminibacter oceani TaxID=291990 RepID=UPI0003175AA0|nr:(Fe-S)-binding protein [Thermosediminibacter oceani]